MNQPVYTNIDGQLIEQPSDHPARLFRESWVLDGQSGITIDTDKQRAIFIGLVKAEAGRRILGAYPEHVQMNGAARAIELLQIGEANWTAEQAAEAAALQDMRDWIKAVRARSNEIEAGPILDDITASEHWPA